LPPASPWRPIRDEIKRLIEGLIAEIDAEQPTEN